MRKKLLSLALALVMCLGLAVPALADGPEVILEDEYGDDYELTLSEYVSKGKATYKRSSADSYPMDMDEYVVNPGTTFVVNTIHLDLNPCRMEDGCYVNRQNEGFDYVELYDPYSSNGTVTVTITEEYAGYWYVNANQNGPCAYFLLHVTGEPVHPSQTAPVSEPDPVPAPTPNPVPTFTDVSPDSPYADAINYAVRKGITKGTSDTTFSPNEGCTNAQILTFLWRRNGEPEPTIANPFTNSIPDAYAKAAIWAYEKGMVSGTTFDVDKPCTRAMTMTYLWIEDGKRDTDIAGVPYTFSDVAAKFTDIPSNASYWIAVAWAIDPDWGITKGTSETTFSPDQTCTRGQIVTFIWRTTQ